MTGDPRCVFIKRRIAVARQLPMTIKGRQVQKASMAFKCISNEI